MNDREWLEALRAEVARMADDMETQRRAYVDLLSRMDELRQEFDEMSEAYAEAVARLDRIRSTLGWRIASRLRSLTRTDAEPRSVVTHTGVVGVAASPEASALPAADPKRPSPAETAARLRTLDSGDEAQSTWAPSVSLIIPTRDRPELLRTLFASIEHTDWSGLEVVLVDHGTTDDEAAALIATAPFTVIRDDGPFNFASLATRGVKESTGEVIVLLNNDIEVLDPGWLHALIACLDTPGCGIAGALLLYPDGSIQHAGLDFEDGEPRHTFARQWPEDVPGDVLAAARTCLAVTGACLAIRRSTWDALGGLEPLFARNYNDVDLCLRAAEAGFTTMITPHACLVHNESATRGTAWDPDIAAEGVLFRARWGRP
jgi:GT2 family glycosyltransferase